MRGLSKILVLACSVAACAAFAGCGGGPQDVRPGPLAKHIDMMHIAQISMDQKQGVLQAQNEWNNAQAQSAKAEADYNALTTQLTVVRNDREKARLQLSSAQSNKKAADASADTNRINASAKEVRDAELALKAADARIRYHEALRGYLLRTWRHAEENMYWKEAQFELAKAQLAQKHNIAPKGVTYDSFPRQESERNQRTAAAKARLDAERNRATAAREEWVRAQQTADQASGVPSSFPDPMMTMGTPTAGTN